MLKHDQIDVPEGIDVNKTDGLRECYICHKWYILEINIRFQPIAHDVCHDIMQKAISSNNVAIVSVKGNNYRIHFLCASKEEAINLVINANLTRKREKLSNKILLLHMKYLNF